MEEPEITVVDYDPSWPQLYEQESDHVQSVLGDQVLVSEHFGSTAVPDLPAKPIIDFCVILKDRWMVSGAIDALENEGYQIHVEWEKRTVLRRSTTEEHQFNLHLASPETLQEIRGNLMFRDYLRDNPTMRERYATVKQEAANEFSNDVKGYYEAKNPIIWEIIETAQQEGYEDQVDLPID